MWFWTLLFFGGMFVLINKAARHKEQLVRSIVEKDEHLERRLQAAVYQDYVGEPEQSHDELTSRILEAAKEAGVDPKEYL